MQELAEAGYDPDNLTRRAVQPVVSVDDLAVQGVASRALDRCAAAASTWPPHTVQEHVTRIVTGAGVRAAPAELREFIDLATGLAVSDCFSVLPPGMVQPEHVAHVTSLNVIAAETALRDQLTAAVPEQEPEHPEVTCTAHAAKLAGKLDKELTALGKNELLVIDELGYIPIDTDGARLLFQAIADAYEQRSLIITTNLAFSQWGQVFGNDDMAAAAIDRIVHHGRMITFTGQSYRMANALMK